MHCARHPSVETGLKCSSCGTPICPACSVPAPVGIKCRDCARHERTASDVGAANTLRALAVTIPVSLAAALVAHSLPFFFLGVLAYGWVVGEAAYISSGRRSGRLVEVIAGLCAAAGLPAVRAGLALLTAGGRPVPWPAALGLNEPFMLAGILLAALIASSRIRFR